MKDYLKPKWKEPYGDRYQQLVFIGIDQDQAKMTALLDEMLLTDEEYNLGSDVWTTDKVRFEDMFPDDFSENLHKKHHHIHHGDEHHHIHNGDAEKKDGWDDCLRSDDDEEIEA